MICMRYDSKIICQYAIITVVYVTISFIAGAYYGKKNAPIKEVVKKEYVEKVVNTNPDKRMLDAYNQMLLESVRLRARIRELEQNNPKR